MPAGIGSITTPSKAGMTGAEVAYSNDISAAEHVVVMIPSLVGNSYRWVMKGG